MLRTSLAHRRTPSKDRDHHVSHSTRQDDFNLDHNQKRHTFAVVFPFTLHSPDVPASQMLAVPRQCHTSLRSTPRSSILSSAWSVYLICVAALISSNACDASILPTFLYIAYDLTFRQTIIPHRALSRFFPRQLLTVALSFSSFFT